MSASPSPKARAKRKRKVFDARKGGRHPKVSAPARLSPEQEAFLRNSRSMESVRRACDAFFISRGLPVGLGWREPAAGTLTPDAAGAEENVDGETASPMPEDDGPPTE